MRRLILLVAIPSLWLLLLLGSVACLALVAQVSQNPSTSLTVLGLLAAIGFYFLGKMTRECYRQSPEPPSASPGRDGREEGREPDRQAAVSQRTTVLSPSAQLLLVKTLSVLTATLAVVCLCFHCIRFPVWRAHPEWRDKLQWTMYVDWGIKGRSKAAVERLMGNPDRKRVFANFQRGTEATCITWLHVPFKPDGGIEYVTELDQYSKRQEIKDIENDLRKRNLRVEDVATMEKMLGPMVFSDEWRYMIGAWSSVLVRFDVNGKVVSVEAGYDD